MSVLADPVFILRLCRRRWPSHLPSPGKLEHIVQSFFDSVPFSTEILSRTRFMARLSMPPTHRDFPHPVSLTSSPLFYPMRATG